MKKTLITFCTFVCLLAVLMPLLPLKGESEIYDSAIRLHVLADSDSKEDQEIKLAVRDCLLEYIKDNIDLTQSIDSVRTCLTQLLDDIEKTAAQKLVQLDCNEDVRVTLTEEYYPTREYEGVSMPRGVYLSLRVIVGAGEGQNWWCVLYPPLCTSAAKPKQTLAEAGFTPDQVRILTENENPKYKLKFRFLEFLQGLFN